jgi:hypothetical protein
MVAGSMDPGNPAYQLPFVPSGNYQGPQDPPTAPSLSYRGPQPLHSARNLGRVNN